MKISLIGATGFVGTALLTELLERKHTINAISRNADKISVNHPTLNKINADVFNENELEEALRGSELVISAYNPGWANSNLREDYLRGAVAIERSVEKCGVKRFLVIGGAGTLKIDGNYVEDRADFPKEIYPGASAVRTYFVETLSQNQVLDWQFFSPALEMNMYSEEQSKTGKYRYGSDSPVFDTEHRSRHSVQDLAVAVADEIENHHFPRQIFTAAY